MLYWIFMLAGAPTIPKAPASSDSAEAYFRIAFNRKTNGPSRLKKRPYRGSSRSRVQWIYNERRRGSLRKKLWIFHRARQRRYQRRDSQKIVEDNPLYSLEINHRHRAL
jgi:hypothetical protein